MKLLINTVKYDLRFHLGDVNDIDWSEKSRKLDVCGIFCWVLILNWWSRRGRGSFIKPCIYRLSESLKFLVVGLVVKRILTNGIPATDEGSGVVGFIWELISKVTFYEVNENYNTYYFAIVCFKSKYSYGCTEYIYQVASNTKMKYSMNYLDSAGKAFWNYIEPYSDNLECSPDLN